MGGFSSRGPFPTVPDWIKPDVTAPGVQILAGMTPEPNSGVTGEYRQYLQGTSMSTPHVSGIAALLIQKHPNWTPAQIKSALMTTAHQNIVKEDGATAADPFDFGAGHIRPNKAIDPGPGVRRRPSRLRSRELRNGLAAPPTRNSVPPLSLPARRSIQRISTCRPSA